MNRSVAEAAERVKTLHAKLAEQQKIGGAATIDDLMDVLEVVGFLAESIKGGAQR